MKYLSVASLSAIAALAAAQQTTQPPSPESSCAAKCDTKDVCCTADCYHVPCPSEMMANDTTGCVAKCEQGDGSEADTEAFAKCAQACISSNFWTNTAPAKTGNGDSPSATATESGGATPTDGSGGDDSGDDSEGGAGGSGGSGGDEGGDSGSEGGSEEGSEEASGDATGSEGAPDATETPGAASQLVPTGASLFGLILAAFAL